MATTTPNFGLRKPATSGGGSGFGDPVDAAADISANMDIIDAALKVLTDKFGTTYNDQHDDATAQTTSTSFVEVLTGGTPCQFAFVAPPSGKVIIYNSSHCDNTVSTARSTCGFALKTGATIGSGSIVYATGEVSGSVWHVGSASNGGTHHTVTGLTPGANYNIRQQFKVTSGTGTFNSKELTVTPAY